MHLFFRLFVVALLGGVIGALSALWFGGLIEGSPKLGQGVDVDGWASDWSIGSESANPYVRARVARHGLLALRKEEAVYFTKATDDLGAPLREDCTYRVSGQQSPAAWWSITLYDSDSRLPMNDDGRLSFDQTQAETLYSAPGQAWEFQVSARPPEDMSMPWVSSRAADTFDLMLRLYEPTAALLADPVTTLTPPQVERVHCPAEGDL